MKLWNRAAGADPLTGRAARPSTPPAPSAGPVATTGPFLEAAARALHSGASAVRVGEVLSLWAGLLRPEALETRRATAVAGPLAEIIEEYRRAAGEEREILYIEDGGGDWLHASIVRPLFLRAIRELLDNVCRHADGWQRITVTAEPVPGEIVVKVRDDGRTAGCVPGLGLCLAEGIAELHGGSLAVEFATGHGLTATTRWPEARPGED